MRPYFSTSPRRTPTARGMREAPRPTSLLVVLDSIFCSSSLESSQHHAPSTVPAPSSDPKLPAHPAAPNLDPTPSFDSGSDPPPCPLLTPPLKTHTKHLPALSLASLAQTQSHESELEPDTTDRRLATGQCRRHSVATVVVSFPFGIPALPGTRPRLFQARQHNTTQGATWQPAHLWVQHAAALHCTVGLGPGPGVNWDGLLWVGVLRSYPPTHPAKKQSAPLFVLCTK